VPVSAADTAHKRRPVCL